MTGENRHANRSRSRGMTVLFAGLLLCLAACGSDSDQNENVAHDPNAWRDDHPQLTFAITLPPELAAMSDNIKKMSEALEDQLSTPVELKRVSGYGGIIQAMAADQVDIATYGAGAFASLYDLIGEDTLPVVAFQNHTGEMGYYSALLVRSDSPFQTIEDLEGKRVGYADFNSTSGYVYPRHILRQNGIEPDTFFADSGITGGHLQSVIALASGQYDAVFTMAASDDPVKAYTTGIMSVIAAEGVIDIEDYRYVWFAGPLPQSAFVMRRNKNPGAVDAITGALAALPYEDPELVRAYGQPRGSTFAAVDLELFRDVIAIRQAEIAGETLPAPTDAQE